MLRTLVTTTALVSVSTFASADPITLDLTGTISRVNNFTGSSISEFSRGDTVVYRVTIDDSGALTGPTAGDADRDIGIVTDFRFRLGSYTGAGGSGDAFLRNDGTTGVFPRPYDQFTVQHLSEPVWDEGFNVPGRTDFQSGAAPVNGVALRDFGITFQHPDVEFVGQGDSLTDIANAVAAQLVSLGTPVVDDASPTIIFGATFMNTAFGTNPITVDSTLDSFTVRSDAPAPLAFGTASAAIVRDTGDISGATKQFDSAFNDAERLDTLAEASSLDGSARARASFGNPELFENQLSDPGLQVGAFADADGEHGESVARSLAFRSFEFSGEEAMQVSINSFLDGEFLSDEAFGVNGTGTAQGGVYVFDALAFANALDFLGGDLNQVLLPLSNEETPYFDYVDPGALLGMSIEDLLGLDALAENTFSLAAAEEGVFEELDLTLDLFAGQQFTVLYDLGVSSEGTCVDGECGAGEVDFFSTLASAPEFFTDANTGGALDSIFALSAPTTNPDPNMPSPVPLPASLWLLTLGLGAIPLTRKMRRT